MPKAYLQVDETFVLSLDSIKKPFHAQWNIVNTATSRHNFWAGFNSCFHSASELVNERVSRILRPA